MPIFICNRCARKLIMKYGRHQGLNISGYGPLGPTAGADMIYTGKRAILFGGTDGIVLGHNNWDWRGNLWTQRQNMGPPSKGLHSIVYDSDRNLVVLFGGIDDSRNFRHMGVYSKEFWLRKLIMFVD